MENEWEPRVPLLIKLCSDKAAFEARIQQRIFFNMNEMRRLFEAIKDHEIMVYTPHIIILKSCKGAEVTFSKDGRMLIKKVLNENEARMVAYDVLRIALKASTISKKS